MKHTTFLAVSDAHCSVEGLAFLDRMLSKHSPDAVLIVGDLTEGGPVEYAGRLLEVVRKRAVPVFAEGGNMDPKEVHEFLEREGVSVHAKSIEFKGYKIAGIGGSLTTPFNTYTEYTEEELRKLAEGLVDGRTIFAPHTPPLNTCADALADGRHVGSSAIREVIERHQPAAALCGHIHEAHGTEFIGKTKLIKIQPLMWKKAVLLEMPSLKTTFLGD